MFMELFITLARALSDESRVRALLVLGGKEVCVCQLIELLELAPSTVSKHMSILKQAGLVTGRKKGRWMYYRLPERPASPIVQQMLLLVRQAATGNEQVLSDAERMEKILGMKREVISEQQSLRRRQSTSLGKRRSS
jgi:ArsR family transcriptional regulator, arsenate/arsenite/antimonite-responsive transcriptional repressor